jgi:hypothetical protein
MCVMLFAHAASSTGAGVTARCRRRTTGKQPGARCALQRSQALPGRCIAAAQPHASSSLCARSAAELAASAAATCARGGGCSGPVSCSGGGNGTPCARLSCAMPQSTFCVHELRPRGGDSEAPLAVLAREDDDELRDAMAAWLAGVGAAVGRATFRSLLQPMGSRRATLTWHRTVPDTAMRAALLAALLLACCAARRGGAWEVAYDTPKPAKAAPRCVRHHACASGDTHTACNHTQRN